MCEKERKRKERRGKELRRFCTKEEDYRWSLQIPDTNLNSAAEVMQLINWYLEEERAYRSSNRGGKAQSNEWKRKGIKGIKKILYKGRGLQTIFLDHTTLLNSAAKVLQLINWQLEEERAQRRHNAQVRVQSHLEEEKEEYKYKRTSNNVEEGRSTIGDR